MKKTFSTIVLLCILISAFFISADANTENPVVNCKEILSNNQNIVVADITIIEEDHNAEMRIKFRIDRYLRQTHSPIDVPNFYFGLAVSECFCIDLLDVPIDKHQETAESILQDKGYLEYTFVAGDVEKAIGILKAQNGISHIQPPSARIDINLDEIQPDFSQLGDIDESGSLDSLDYILMKRIYFGTADYLYYLSEEFTEVADMNRDGQFDSLDYILVKRMYFGTWSPDT